MSRVLLVLLAVGLAVYALVDLASSDDERRGGVPKALWVVLVILLPFLGPIAWILVSRAASRGTGGSGVGRGSGPSGSGPGRRRGAPVAPDDDPDFLWRLDQQQRRQSRETGAADGPADAPDADQPGTDGTTEDDNGTTGNSPGRDEPGTR
ncbi:PLDc_N domain-containing protein [Cellulosimicrobium terreum]|nr:PLDc_N domain-containing protein [Cellulosimicrobium terreum]